MAKEIVKDIDTCVSDTKNVVSDLKDFSDEVSKIHDAPLPFKKLKSVIDSSTFRSLSAGLSAASALLGVVTMFSGGESSTQKILDAISGVSGQIEDLQNLIIDKFDILTEKISDEVITTDLLGHLAVVDTSISYFQLYLKAKNESERKIELDNLYSIGQQTLDIAATEIKDQVLGKLSSNNSGLMEVRLDSTYGDIRSVLDLYLKLLRYLLAAFLIRSFLDVAKELKDKNICLDSLSNVQNLIKENLSKEELSVINADITTNLEFYNPILFQLKEKSHNAITSGYKHMESNMDKYLGSEILPDIKSSNINDIATDIVSNLGRKFSWVSHVAIVYDPLLGFENHTITGSGTGGYIAYFRRNIGGTKKNIIVIYVDPDYHIAANEVRRKVSFSFDSRQPAPGGLSRPVTKTVENEAEKINWAAYNKTLPDADYLIRSENKEKNKNKEQKEGKETDAVIWIAKRHSHSCYVHNENFPISFQWRFGEDTPYIIGIFE